ncbi:hypothetical protein [Sphaerisporangium siamense]|uniref:Uncharacterized protein n=1 Tax=Sphaerisporangium siamense TaxID=795645 RepID=A0A7W7D5F3_9ACTN|nr:hypothetical protein [Sphaerisporangium siamense]MBB4700573.1 hypothetical protein [Sphaerisporangium siamense]
MVFSLLAVWLLAAAVPATTLMIVAIVALRGTEPDQRPEILRALAILARANHRHLPFLGGKQDAAPSIRGSSAK